METLRILQKDEVVKFLLPIIEDETRQGISNMLDCEEVSRESSTAIVKFAPMVEYGGHQIFKAALVSQLNTNPFLSKDRLTQVKYSIYFNYIDDHINASSSPISMLVRLGFDVGIFLGPKIKLESLQQLKLPNNTIEGDLPRATSQL